jgi:hypothetical protein
VQSGSSWKDVVIEYNQELSWIYLTKIFEPSFSFAFSGQLLLHIGLPDEYLQVPRLPKIDPT